MSRFHGMRNEEVIEILVKEEVEKMNIVSGKDLIISNLLIKVSELDKRIEKLEEGKIDLEDKECEVTLDVTTSSDEKQVLKTYSFNKDDSTFTEVDHGQRRKNHITTILKSFIEHIENDTICYLDDKTTPTVFEKKPWKDANGDLYKSISCTGESVFTMKFYRGD